MTTYEVMDERGNCHMRLKQRLTNRRQLWREGKLSDDDFRLAESIAEDMEIYRAASGGLLQRVPGQEAFIAMPRGSRSVAPQERHGEALQRIAWSHAALMGRLVIDPKTHERTICRDAVARGYRRRTPALTIADFDHWIIDDPPLRAFERRCKLKQGHGAGLEYIYWLLDRVGSAQVYDSVKWRVVIRGEAA